MNSPVNSPGSNSPLVNPDQKKFPRQFPPGEFPRYFFKYQTELRLTVSSYHQINKIYKCWLCDRKGLRKERNKRHVPDFTL